MPDTLTISANGVITFVALCTALGSIIGLILAVYRWYLQQNKQDVDIASIKEEQCLLTYGVLACLKGLSEQGCNGPVTEAINKIERHINKSAHR